MYQLLGFALSFPEFQYRVNFIYVVFLYYTLQFKRVVISSEDFTVVIFNFVYGVVPTVDEMQ